MEEFLFRIRKQTQRSSIKEFINFAGGSGVVLPEDQVQCSICLEVFTEPVTTPCGHNFCRDCLTQCWDRSPQCHCPLCKEKYAIRPDLKVNITLREVTEHFRKRRPLEEPEVPCDACPGEKQPALKSCLDCGLTFCRSHLEPHNTISKLQKHKLINPLKNLESYICPKHQRPLDRFCMEDQKWLCEFCTFAGHKNHNIMPLEKWNGESKNNLEKTQTAMQTMIQDRIQKIQEIKDSVELSKRNTEQETAESVEVLSALTLSIERTQAELLESMEEKQKAAEKQAEELIKDLQQEIAELQKREAKLQQLLHSEEHLKFLKVQSSVCRIPPSKNWTDISMKTDLGTENMKTALSVLQKALNKKLSETINQKLKDCVDAELKRIQSYTVDVTLDPDTAHPNLLLSADRKEVTRVNRRRFCLDQPKRFTFYTIVLGQQSFSSGRFYYEVDVGEKTEWELGVCRESVNRKGKLTLSPQFGLWNLVLSDGGQYTACDSPAVPLSLRERLRRVGVFVDYEAGQVSFYDVENRSHIYSFTGQCFTERLYPYFWPGDADGKNTAPLIIGSALKTK